MSRSLRRRLIAAQRHLVTIIGVVFASATLAPSTSAQCPGALRFDGNAAQSDVDFGWQGIAHDFPLIGGALTMKTSCLPSNPTPCTNCSVSGPVPNVAGYNQRCAGDTSKLCTTATANADCGADGPCAYYLAPPQPIGVGGVAVCLVEQIGGPLSGTLNVPAGDFTSLTMPLSWDVYNGLAIDRPCPRCIGDPTPNDAVRGGTCDAGARSGLPCDGNAVATITDFGTTSYDCPPLPLGSLGKLAVPTVPFSSRTGGHSVTLTNASPDCTFAPSSGLKCFCQTCATAAQEPCFGNADCPGVTCGGRRCLLGPATGTPCSIPGSGDPICLGGVCGIPGEPTRPNSCMEDTSTPGSPACVDTAPVGDNEAECVNGPVDQFCAPPEQYRGCVSGADCPLTATCEPKLRECYPDNGVLNASVGVSGVADPPTAAGIAHPTLGALYCLPPMVSAAANNVGGFPGLGRLKLPGTLTLAQEIASRPVATDSSLSTGSDPTGGVDPSPTGSDPIETTVTTPNAGPVSIVEQTTTGSPPSGYTFVNQQANITAPPATNGNPLIIKFFIDASRLTTVPGSTCGIKKTNIVVLKDGGPTGGVGACGNPSGPPNASPTSPCIAKRECVSGDTAASSDVKITVWTATASIWQVAIPVPAPAITIAGKKLQIKDADAVTKRKLTLQLADASLTAPVPGSGDDPRCVGNGGSGGGATLDVFGTGGSPQYVGITLPCENWTTIGKPTDGKGYKYKDSHLLAGPCTSVSLKNGQMKATCSGKSLAQPLDYDLQNGEGSVGVTFRMGSTHEYCTEFAGTTAAGNPVIKKDDARTFQAQDAPVPGTCPVQ